MESDLSHGDSSAAPIRVAVISPGHVVRAGLVSLIAHLGAHAIVTEAVDFDEDLGYHDVAIYDLGAIDEVKSDRDVRRLLESGAEVIGLVYGETPTKPAPTAALLSGMITLRVTPDRLLEILRECVPSRRQLPGDGEALRLPAGLSEQEFRVIEHIGAGLSNQEICTLLFISINTLKSTIRGAYRKLGVEDRSSAVRWAHDHGLAGGPERP